MTLALLQAKYKTIAESGANYVRFKMYPPNTAKGSKVAEIGEAVKNAEAEGLTVLPYLGDGAFPKPGSPWRTRWLEYAEEVGREFGPGSEADIDTWEIWNEPNMPFPKQTSNDFQGQVNPKGFGTFFVEMVEHLKQGVAGAQSSGPTGGSPITTRSVSRSRAVADGEADQIKIPVVEVDDVGG